MKTNKKITFKLTTLIATVLFSISTTFAQPGVVDLIMRGMDNNSSTTEIITIPAEQNKLYSIILVNESGEKFNKTVRLNSRSKKISFTLSAGFYSVIIVDLATGCRQQYTVHLY